MQSGRDKTPLYFQKVIHTLLLPSNPCKKTTTCRSAHFSLASLESDRILPSTIHSYANFNFVEDVENTRDIDVGCSLWGRSIFIVFCIASQEREGHLGDILEMNLLAFSTWRRAIDFYISPRRPVASKA